MVTRAAASLDPGANDLQIVLPPPAELVAELLEQLRRLAQDRRVLPHDLHQHAEQQLVLALELLVGSHQRIVVLARVRGRRGVGPYRAEERGREEEVEDLLLLLVAVLALEPAQADHAVVLALVGFFDVLAGGVDDLDGEVGRRHPADQDDGAVFVGEIVTAAVVLPAMLGGEVAGLAHLPA